MQQNDIGYVLNASNTCPKPDFIPESHFLRVPVNDSFCEKILPWLDKSVDFIGEKKLHIGSLKQFLGNSVSDSYLGWRIPECFLGGMKIP